MKVLIISHNPICNHNNMGKTLRSLFSEFGKEELCQLYFYPTLPDVDMCSSYYRITDIDILKSYFFRLKNNSGEIENSDFSNYMSADVLRSVGYRTTSELKRIFRDVLWKCSFWYDKKLDNWIKKEKPTKIFLVAGDAKFIYDIAIKISKKFGIPIVSYICDEYYFFEGEKKCLSRVRFGLLRKKIDTIAKYTEKFICISESMSQLYHQYFKIKAVTIMTGTNILKDEPKVSANVQSITYLGNIRCGRNESLADIGRALDEINSNYDTKYKLKLYTAEQDNTFFKTFENISSIECCGFATGEMYHSVLESSSVLVHVEAIDNINKNLVKHSISTKIPEILGSGIPMIAYGPLDVASIQHLYKNDCAVIVNSKDQLISGLNLLFNDYNTRIQKANNGLLAAKIFHNAENNSKKLKEELK